MRLADEASFAAALDEADAYERFKAAEAAAAATCRGADGELDETLLRRRLRGMKPVTITPTTLRCHRYDAICAGVTYTLWSCRGLRSALLRELAVSAAAGVGIALRRAVRLLG